MRYNLAETSDRAWSTPSAAACREGLRPGYSRDLRIGAFLYALLFPALNLAALLLSGE